MTGIVGGLVKLGAGGDVRLTAELCGIVLAGRVDGESCVVESAVRKSVMELTQRERVVPGLRWIGFQQRE